ncbi:MAG: DUF3344 domain-containing protein [Streptomyces sp.]|uniref:DUF3344 domain-containing protein n=1 Tax=Streptomyces sp. TaxID=1931 RepID=UPI003D6B681A
MARKKNSVLRGLCCAVICMAAMTPTPAIAAPPSKWPAPDGPLTERYHALRHGGIVRAANTAITCRKPVGTATACRAVQRGAGGDNADYEMFYSDVDRDPNTYNSTRARLRLPKTSKVRYARLYWGGNLRVGEVKPAKDNGRVLLAEPRGAYRPVWSDTLRTYRRGGGVDAYQASANVTPLVGRSGPGSYTVAQVNVAKGHSAAGAWGGWTLVVVYEDAKAPLRHLTLWDGLAAPGSRTAGVSAGSRYLGFPAGAKGSVGVVGYDGDRGSARESFTLAADKRAGTPLSNSVNPSRDTFNSTITDRGREVPGRTPAHRNTLGYDSDVFDAATALRPGGRRLLFRFASRDDDYLLGALYAQVDARR